MNVSKYLICFFVVFLYSCASVNPYTQFYKQNPNFPHEDSYPTDYVEIIRTDDIDNTSLDLFTRGYELIGVSGFNGEQQDEDSSIIHAKMIGAEIVILNTEFAQTQLTTSGYYGNAFWAVPIQEEILRFEHSASYFRKVPFDGLLGIKSSNLNLEQKKEYETNAGVFLQVVILDTPADKAGLIPGDVLVKINNERVSNNEKLQKILESLPKGKANLEIIRKEKRENIKIYID
ncbi:PDZ domain-containing protein [Gammaproteobacteria bacterium]|nr:PDZ domain-containing protein [Gammaproteobacteria bacterium]